MAPSSPRLCLVRSLPAEEVSVSLVDVDRVAVAVRHVSESVLVDGDVGRQLER